MATSMLFRLCSFLLFITFLSLAASANAISEKCNPEDKRALLQIKKDLNNPTLLSSWNPHTDCCDQGWNGITCDPKTNRVDSLSLSYDSLSSQIPPSIGNLPYLQELSLYQLPNLNGPIPQEITKLTNLKYLTISFTNVSGPIPNFLAKMKNLDTLNFAFSSFSGTLPPSLYQLPRISGILFDYNKITGPLPDSYGYFKNNPTLSLPHNHITGRIPLSFARLNLSYINLSENRLEGDASMLFGYSKVTYYIDLSSNMFAFDLGKVVLPKALTSLYLNHNHIYGKLPVGIQNVKLLDVSYNRLCGEIPNGGKLQKFHSYVYSHNKCLCGSPLPRCKVITTVS